MKQAKTSDVQLTEARDKMTTLKQEAKTTEDQLKSALWVGLAYQFYCIAVYTEDFRVAALSVKGGTV